MTLATNRLSYGTSRIEVSLILGMFFNLYLKLCDLLAVSCVQLMNAAGMLLKLTVLCYEMWPLRLVRFGAAFLSRIRSELLNTAADIKGPRREIAPIDGNC